MTATVMSVEDACGTYGERATNDGLPRGSNLWQVHACGTALAVLLTGSTEVDGRARDACLTFGRLAFAVGVADAFRHAQTWTDPSVVIKYGHAVNEILRERASKQEKP